MVWGYFSESSTGEVTLLKEEWIKKMYILGKKSAAFYQKAGNEQRMSYERDNPKHKVYGENVLLKKKIENLWRNEDQHLLERKPLTVILLLCYSWGGGQCHLFSWQCVEWQPECSTFLSSDHTLVSQKNAFCPKLNPAPTSFLFSSGVLHGERVWTPWWKIFLKLCSSGSWFLENSPDYFESLERDPIFTCYGKHF